MRNFLLYIILFSFTFCYNYAQKEKPKEKIPISLKYADSLVGTKGMEGFRIREYAGNVQFEQNNVLVTCNRAFQYLDENKAELIGNVIITQEDLILKSPRILYNGNTGIANSFEFITITDKNAKLTAKKGIYNTETYIADFEGDCKITDDSVTILSDKIKYNRKTRFSYAFGNVKVEDDSVIIYSDTIEHDRSTRNSLTYGNVIVKGKYDNVILFGDTLVNIYQDKYTKATGNPLLFQIDTVSIDTLYRYLKIDSLNNKTIPVDSTIIIVYDTLSISSDIMEAYRENDKEKYLFTGNVELVQKDVAAIGKLAIYKKQEEIIELYQNPIVWYDSTQLHADTIFVYTQNKKLSQIKALNNALAATKNDSIYNDRISQIIGKSIRIVFKNDTVDYIISNGDAKSLFFQQGENEESGAARNSADSIRIIFQNGEPYEFISLGANQGEFFPEKLYMNKEKEYYLPNFRWNNMKPKKKEGRVR